MWRLLLVPALLLVGCGEEPGRSAEATEPEPPAASPTAPVLPAGQAWVQLFAPRGGLDRSSPDVTVLVMEHDCTGARDPRPHLNDPAVIEDRDRVMIAWTIAAPGGNNTCPGNPSVEQVVHLDEPLGDRELLDGSTWPPTPVE